MMHPTGDQGPKERRPPARLTKRWHRRAPNCSVEAAGIPTRKYPREIVVEQRHARHPTWNPGDHNHHFPEILHHHSRLLRRLDARKLQFVDIYVVVVDPNDAAERVQVMARLLIERLDVVVD